MKKYSSYGYIFLLTCCLLSACNKDAFLDQKPNTGIVIPTSLPDLRGLMDNTSVFTYSPGLGEISADNYFLSYTSWQAQASIASNAYIWQKDILGATRSLPDWSQCYQQILYTNIVLEQLKLLTPSASDLPEWTNQMGTALFLRAFANYNLVSHFAAAYDSSTASIDLGIPIKESSDIHQIVQRSTIQQTYNKIFTDLRTSSPLLSSTSPSTARNRPSQPAAYALLSRICISMRNYDGALKYADTCLSLYNNLIDYNTISTTATTPFIKANDEGMYYCDLIDYPTFDAISSVAFIDTLLYQSYAANDLRKSIYFRTIVSPNVGIKRMYSGTIFLYSGLAVDEVYLNHAESLARAGNISGAMNDLNTLLSKRWKTGTYVNLTASSPSDALQKIQIERRKELVGRGLRWTDLKRYNKEGSAITLTRLLNGVIYSLPPNSTLYVLPIPDDEISQSGIVQNPR